MISRKLPSDWTRRLADHGHALEEYCATVDALSRDAWMEPLAPGKWTPAEVTAHVIEAYRVLTAELAGAAGMRMLGSSLQRLVLRHTMLPRLLAGKPFPAGVRAPRETRPREILANPGSALAELARLAEEFTRDLSDKAAAQERVRLTHAYFGLLSPRQGLELLTVHTRHHARQLAAVTDRRNFNPSSGH